MKKFFHEFKEFAMRGSVIDLAVGVIIGGAFQKIVNSLVTNVISPIIGLFAKSNFDNLSLDVMGVSIKYGAFITEFINFIIMAFVIFLMIKLLNGIRNIHKKDDFEEALTTQKCPFCMSEIDIKATRCPHCTSILEAADNDNTADIEDTEPVSE